MPRVRVFLCTYRRPLLLKRALDSLLAQSFTDWICEVRNDAPDDTAPEAVVRAAGDPRLHYVQHASNLGGVALFNHVFSPQPEPYVALLEDDNWWHADFLARMVEALDAHPDVTLAWSNQNIWEEAANGTWSDTGRLVRAGSSDYAPFRCHWPHAIQCFGALHANGAMLLRTRRDQSFPTPSMEFGGTEAVRERSIPHPLLFVPEPLAVIAFTQSTHRSKNAAIWAVNQVLLSATFLKHAKIDASFRVQLWADARNTSPRMTDTLMLATLQDRSVLHHLSHATLGDWWHLLLHSVRHPVVLLRILRSRTLRPEIWNFLDLHSAARTKERSSEAGPIKYSAELVPHDRRGSVAAGKR
jgi:hypothetical protein